MPAQLWIILLVALALPVGVEAKTDVIQGAKAKALYETNRAKAVMLVQKHKIFILRRPDGKEESNPKLVRVRIGQPLYIANEEDIFVHNVYDLTDASWVLKKQTPASMAAIMFDTPGTRQLRCAIHPTMEISVEVTP